MRVAITGAAGRIGRRLMPGLADAGHDVRGIDVVHPDEPWADGVVVADLGTDDAALTDVLTGADAVVHLAAIAGESDFATALDSHLGLTHRVLEGARDLNVGRVVYASSNHAVGFTPRASMVPIETRVRPDTFYGVGKAAAEALCSLYHDRHGLAVACLRIGSFRERPSTRRELSTWLSIGDAIRLVDACVRTSDLGFAIVYGISNNTRAWWDLAPGRAIGYHPVDDAERWAADIEATSPSEVDELDGRHVGGAFARPDPPRSRRRP
jgi:uronate dehydrogenase